MERSFWEKIRFFFLLLIISFTVQQTCSSNGIKSSKHLVPGSKDIKENVYLRARERRKEEEVEEQEQEAKKKKQRKGGRRSIDFEEELD